MNAEFKMTALSRRANEPIGDNNMSAIKLEPGLDSVTAQVVEELIDKLQAGDGDVEAFIAANAEHESALRRLLPALKMMADLSRDSRNAAGIRLPPGEAGTDAERWSSRSEPGEGVQAPLCGQHGDYRILREVGRGGMGIVYEAEQLSLRRRVALKVLPFAAAMDPRQLQRFHNEALAAASLHHEHIIPVYAVGCERGVHFYAMQFIEGLTLAEMIAELRGRESGAGSRESEETELLGPRSPIPDARPPAAATRPIAALSTERTKDK